MKIKLAVLFGGMSVEHEVSVISALQAVASLDTSKYDIYPVYMTKNNEFYTGPDAGFIESYRDIPALLKKCTRCFFIKDGIRILKSKKRMKDPSYINQLFAYGIIGEHMREMYLKNAE